MKSSTLTKITTCQICARPIKANTGTIAHHGYSRPGFGYQTRSCYGAHYLPYEQSRDAITGAIEASQNYIQSRIKFINDMIDSAPATITRHSKYFEDEVYTKPEDFDPKAAAAGSFSYSEDYAREFSSQIRTARKDIKETEISMTFLQERFDNWKPAV